jgi:hypothetical protein
VDVGALSGAGTVVAALIGVDSKAGADTCRSVGDGSGIGADVAGVLARGPMFPESRWEVMPDVGAEVPDPRRASPSGFVATGASHAVSGILCGCKH